MCVFSMCGQIVYGLLMVACIAMTATALFTSSWSDVKDLQGHSEGLMPWTCVGHSQGEDCEAWWDNQPAWHHAVVIMMCLALACEIIAVAWNIVTFFACCCKRCIIHPLSPLAFFITLLLLSSIVVYGVNNKDIFKQQPNLDTELGWSFWVAVGALVLAAVDTIVGALTVCLGERSL